MAHTYLEYWGFRKSPFENVPDGSIFFHSIQHKEALSRLLFAVEQRKGAAMLTGEVGSGKTTVGKALESRLPGEKFNVQSIINPALEPIDFIRAILLAIDESANTDSKVLLLNRLQNRLVQNAAQGLNNVLIIDEAHLIKNEAGFEELRMLLNMQSDNHFLITLIILGQPKLHEYIERLKPLKERISVKYHVTPLNLRDTVRYILYRLKSAGAERGIFTKESIFPIYEYARGLPLRINNLCDRCLLVGFMNRTRVVNAKTVDEAIADLEQTQ